MTISIEQLQGLAGHGKVLTDHGDKVGSIGQVYVDDSTNEPDWVTVKTGLFGTAETFVPLRGATVRGSDIVVGYDKDTIKAAPRVDADGAIGPDEEQNLFRHYGLAGTGGRPEAGDGDRSDLATGRDRSKGWDGTGDVPSDLDDPSEEGDNRPDISGRTVGYDRSGPTTDEAMTRSEERLQVGTTTRESGRARLRKYVMTERVSQNVPVSHEEARLVREPITTANSGSATAGPAFSEAEHEVVLHDEVPVVQKTAVPVERVRLNKQTVTEQETVTEQVRKEQIDMDGPKTLPGR
ncbi:MAG TPA: PRC and DUF2382 domain-containing protein [Propionibacteriaceae bacterium]